jgi:hypothetical protein
MYHSPECKCGFGGEGHLGGRSGGQEIRRRVSNQSLISIAVEEGKSIVVPVRCRFCQQDPIYLFASPSGGFTVFDSLGLPWPKHMCSGEWTDQLFADCFEGRTITAIALPEPATPDERLRYYYAQNSDVVDKWLRRARTSAFTSGERKYSSYRLELDSFDICPQKLAEILEAFCDAKDKRPRVVQMLQPMIDLIRAKARYMAQRESDADSPPSTDAIVDWLTNHGLPAYAPLPQQYSKDGGVKMRRSLRRATAKNMSRLTGEPWLEWPDWVDP